MSYELLTALVGFALVGSITPGPNNMMLMASGANFGFRLTIPHMFGIGAGFMVMIFLVGIGLIGVFDAWPPAHTLLTMISVAYLLWLAWKIANAAAPETGQTAGKPLSFLQAAMFQWVNPKAWTMSLTAITLYAPDRSLLAITLVALAFGLVNLPSTSTWTILGQQLRRLLSSPARLRAFNWTMAALLVASLIPVVYPSGS
ncbi:LysE family translocator [Rhodobacteraceae bacterium D3-12]|nr:LysE family translocator [Rhodobacteraceae bacterium D3-12]